MHATPHRALSLSIILALEQEDTLFSFLSTAGTRSGARYVVVVGVVVGVGHLKQVFSCGQTCKTFQNRN